MHNKKYRINFKLPKSVYEIFTQIAQKKGVTRSSLLRENIEKNNIIRIHPLKPSLEKVSFHLLISKEKLELIELYARGYNISRSSLLNIIVRNIIHDYPKQLCKNNNNEMDFRNLYHHGLHDEILYRSITDIEKLNSENLYVLALLYTDLGDEKRLIDVQNMLGQVGKKDKNIMINVLRLKSLRIEQLLSLNKIKDALVKASSFMNEPYLFMDSEIQSMAYFHMARLHLKKENPASSYYFLLKSLEHLNLTQHPINIARTYIYIAHLERYGMCNVDANVYFDRARQILEGLDNRFYLAWLDCHYGSYLLTKSKNEKAVSVLHNACLISKKYNSKKQIYLANIYLAKANIESNKDDIALKTLESCKNYEALVRGTNDVTNVYTCFLASKRNYKNAIYNLQQLNRIESHKEWNQYIFHTAQFLHAPDYKEREEGAQNLYRLSKIATYPTLREAAEATLTTKNPQLNKI